MKFESPLRRVRRKLRQLNRLDELDHVRQALGRIEKRQVLGPGPNSLARYEFRVYSQAGEDGIIQFLVNTVRIPRRVFVEFGVEDYREANTRFLALNDHWSGLVMDADAANVQAIHGDPGFWRLNVDAVQAFITRENINSLLQSHGVTGEIGLLSIDIDGNDYWVWEAIDVIHPAVVVIEYNYRFGRERAVAVPYSPAFARGAAHPSGIYFGASLKALYQLGLRKGYAFVGCNQFGVNAFFVRRDLMTDAVQPVTHEEGYVEGSFREAFGGETRSYIDHAEEARLISDLPLVELD